jgi:hypothetical protein
MYRSLGIDVALDKEAGERRTPIKITRAALLVPRLGTARGVVVATYREPDAGSDAVVGAQLSPGASATSVTLSGFRREELGQLLSRLSGEPANARLVEWLHAQTAGNPYFAQELFRLLRSRGLTG